jgi:hypothetical protein
MSAESTHRWYEFVEDDLETQPRDGAKIMAELENGTQGQAIYSRGGGLSWIGKSPEGTGRTVNLKRWRYLNIP